MAPKKKEQKKVMSLGDFLADEKTGGSWADEMEDYPTTDSRPSFGGMQAAPRTYNSTSNTYGTGESRGYSVREELPLPDKPPYTVHLGNLSFDATNGDVQDFFTDCEVVNVRIIEDRVENKPKGFGYAEFGSLDGLKKALTLNGSQFQGRNIRISVADPPKDRGDGGSSFRQIDDWSRKGPLPDLPTRGGNERRGGFGGDFGGERRQRNFEEGDGKVRDFGNWERKGPLSPVAQPERPSREGGRPRNDDISRNESFRDRTPAQWGEGRPQGSQDGSRPPRREFQERPVVERAPTAAEQDNQWRAKMRPDIAPSPTDQASREGSEAPSSPAPAATPTLASRPKLNLAKRTVTEQDLSAASSSDSKASPFGAARPIDTAAKEREIEEKKEAAAKEKKEAEEKARAEREAAKKAAEEEAAKVEADKKVEILKKEDDAEGETIETENANGQVVDDKAVKPKEVVRDARPRPSDTGAWRKPTNGPPPPRDDVPRGPREGGRGRGGRGRGEGRGGRGGYANERQYSNDGRLQRQNTNTAATTSVAPTPADEKTETVALEEDGWSTVSKPNKKSGRGGARAIAS